MSLRILSNSTGSRACFYCDTTDWAFGPVSERHILEAFEHYLLRVHDIPDARIPHDPELHRLWIAFHSNREYVDDDGEPVEQVAS